MMRRLLPLLPAIALAACNRPPAQSGAETTSPAASPAPADPARSTAPTASAVASAPATGRVDPARARQLVVGTWTSERDPSLVYVVSPDGTVTSTGKLDSGKTLEYSATWTIDDEGRFVETITASSLPDLLPVGTISRDRLVSIDESSFAYETERGEQRRKTRRPQG